MPISIDAPIRRLSQNEFGEIAYDVMRQIFEIHNELGRFFHEKIYKRELARRRPDVRLETAIDVSFDTFRTLYFIDVLAGEGAIFELKSVEDLSPRHHAQLLNYLLLCDVAHGKLINLRPEKVEHEFVNTQWHRATRTLFKVDVSAWNKTLPGSAQLYDFLISFLRDVGTGLAEDAVTHCFGGPDCVEVAVPIKVGGHFLGRQRMRLIGPGVAFKITAFDGPLEHFEFHARRLLAHADLVAIAWINVNMEQVTFTALTR